jgi:hypothetical protein
VGSWESWWFPWFSQDFQTKPSILVKLQTNSPKSRNFQEVFKHFDENGDQKLNAQEMLAFDSWSSIWNIWNVNRVDVGLRFLVEWAFF